MKHRVRFINKSLVLPAKKYLTCVSFFHNFPELNGYSYFNYSLKSGKHEEILFNDRHRCIPSDLFQWSTGTKHTDCSQSG
jgi:hypothetical protein